MQTDPQKINTHVKEARRRGIKILPPDINESGRKFTLTKDGDIRYGLDTISHVGKTAVDEILKHRPYTSLEDLVERTAGRVLNKRVVVNLIKIGAFDSLGDRSDTLQKYYDLRKIDDPVPDFTKDEVVYETEMELVGTYILKDPMERFQGVIERVCAATPKVIDDLEPGAIGKVGGQLTKIKEHTTRGGKPMAFIEVTYNEEVFPITVFPQAWSNMRGLMTIGAPVACGVEKLDDGCHLVHLERLDYIIT